MMLPQNVQIGWLSCTNSNSKFALQGNCPWVVYKSRLRRSLLLAGLVLVWPCHFCLFLKVLSSHDCVFCQILSTCVDDIGNVQLID